VCLPCAGDGCGTALRVLHAAMPALTNPKLLLRCTSTTSQCSTELGETPTKANIIESSRLKRTTMIIWFQPPAMCRVANQQPRLPRATSSLASMPAGMGHPQPPWATCSVRHRPLGEKLPPHIQPKAPLSQFKTISPCPVTTHTRKQPFPLLFIQSLQVLEGHHEVSPEPSLLQAKAFIYLFWRSGDRGDGSCSCCRDTEAFVHVHRSVAKTQSIP